MASLQLRPLLIELNIMHGDAILLVHSVFGIRKNIGKQITLRGNMKISQDDDLLREYTRYF